MAAMQTTKGETSLWRRLGWFVAIWAASILALGLVTYGLKALFGL